MIRPVLQGKAFLADVRHALDQPDSLHIWWLGQSGFLVQWKAKHLLFDPYLSDSLTHKYAATDKPHVRMTERVTAPDDLDFIDVVTSTHNHTDHLDADTLVPLFKANPSLRLISPSANHDFIARRLGHPPGDLSIIGLDDGTTTTVSGFTFTGVPAAHESLDRDEQGRHLYLGYIVQAGPWAIYHSGDTVNYPGLAERLKRASVDLAFLPINGRSPERRVSGNMNGPEAARLANAGGVRHVVPCHYEMFEFNTASPADFIAECKLLNQRHHVLHAGERLSLILPR